MGKNIKKDFSIPYKYYKEYRYLTERDILRKGDEEWISRREVNLLGWYPVPPSMFGEHVQIGEGLCVRRKRVKNIKSRKVSKSKKKKGVR